MRLICTIVIALLAAADARMIAPLRRSTALKLLKRLAEGSHDLLSIDIGGTLAKVMVYQPADGPPPEDGQPPEIELGAIGQDSAFHDPEQLGLSVYAPDLGGNLVACCPRRHAPTSAHHARERTRANAHAQGSHRASATCARACAALFRL